MNHFTTSEGCGTVFEELYALMEINGFFLNFPVLISAMCIQNGQVWSIIQKSLTLVQASAIWANGKAPAGVIDLWS